MEFPDEWLDHPQMTLRHARRRLAGLHKKVSGFVEDISQQNRRQARTVVEAGTSAEGPRAMAALVTEVGEKRAKEIVRTTRTIHAALRQILPNLQDDGSAVTSTAIGEIQRMVR